MSRNPVNVTTLLEELGAPHKATARLAAHALAAAAADDPSVVQALHAALSDPRWRYRWGAAYALSLLPAPAPEALPVLLEVLGCDDGDLRWAAAVILQRCGGAAVPALLDLAASAPPVARRMALYCLRDLGTSGAAMQVALADSLEHPDPAVRLAALSAVAETAADDAVATVLALTADPDPGVRRAAVSSLGKLGKRTAEVEAAVHAAGRDSDVALRRAARYARRRLGMGE